MVFKEFNDLASILITTYRTYKTYSDLQVRVTKM